MRILGIDPGIAIVGFGLIEADRGRTQLLNYGAITTPAGLPLARRLVQIEQDMEALIAQLKPDAIAVEELFFSNNITTGIAVALGEIDMPTDADVMHNRELFSSVASCSSGVELDQAQVVVVGNARGVGGRDALQHRSRTDERA